MGVWPSSTGTPGSSAKSVSPGATAPASGRGVVLGQRLSGPHACDHLAQVWDESANARRASPDHGERQCSCDSRAAEVARRKARGQSTHRQDGQDGRIQQLIQSRSHVREHDQGKEQRPAKCVMVDGQSGGAPGDERAEDGERRDHPYRRRVADPEECQLAGGTYPADRAIGPRERHRHECREEAALTGPLNDPEHERSRPAAGCHEPRESSPVLPDTEPGEHGECRPYPRQFAGGREAGEHSPNDHPSSRRAAARPW